METELLKQQIAQMREKTHEFIMRVLDPEKKITAAEVAILPQMIELWKDLLLNFD